MFVHFNGKIINSNDILWIDYHNLVKNNYIKINSKSAFSETVFGAEAFNVVMELCPAALEGQQAKYHRHAWVIHNLIGHPLMQICSWLSLTKLGLKIHDKTIPMPIE